MGVMVERSPLGFLWETQDPFLFCAHHLDAYPKGADSLGPAMPLSGRELGQDFDLSNDWKMYHGQVVPGFPVHPHRGFETVTIVLEGYVDHSDSTGASGRYGQGDVQWMTAGSGMQHAEMFPLLSRDQGNTLHLFQIWLNLPKVNKFVEPHYKMLWHEDIPVLKDQDYELRLIAGSYEGHKAVPPAPDSWAADEDHHVDIFLVTLAQGGKIKIPAKTMTQKRAIYVYEGDKITVDGEALESGERAFLSSKAEMIKGGGKEAKILVLQAEPINEPVVQYGPFVMNTQEEIRHAYADYQNTGFGGWPWNRPDPVHGSEIRRYAAYSDGRVEER